MITVYGIVYRHKVANVLKNIKNTIFVKGGVSRQLPTRRKRKTLCSISSLNAFMNMKIVTLVNYRVQKKLIYDLNVQV